MAAKIQCDIGASKVNPNPVEVIISDCIYDEDRDRPFKVHERIVDMKYKPDLEPPFTAVIECRMGHGFAYEGYLTRADLRTMVEDNILSSNADTEKLALSVAPEDVKWGLLEQRAKDAYMDIHFAEKNAVSKSAFCKVKERGRPKKRAIKRKSKKTSESFLPFDSKKSIDANLDNWELLLSN